jgi:hypothetical protein
MDVPPFLVNILDPYSSHLTIEPFSTHFFLLISRHGTHPPKNKEID